MLAGTLKAPSRYSPRADMDNSLARMSLVLDAMAENGFITTAQAEAAKQERPLLAKESANDYPFGYYTDMVQTSAKNCLGVTQSELLSGGYTIYANLDPSLQSKIENLQQDDTLFPPNAGDGDPCQCAVVVLNAKPAMSPPYWADVSIRGCYASTGLHPCGASPAPPSSP